MTPQAVQPMERTAATWCIGVVALVCLASVLVGAGVAPSDETYRRMALAVFAAVSIAAVRRTDSPVVLYALSAMALAGLILSEIIL